MVAAIEGELVDSAAPITSTATDSTGPERPADQAKAGSRRFTPAGRFERVLNRRSENADFLGFLALAARCHLELHPVALVQALVSASLDVREMHEHVRSTLA